MGHLPDQARVRPAAVVAVVCLAAVAALAGCEPETPAGVAEGNGPAGAGVWPRPQPALSPDPELERRVAELLSRMSLEQKVGQIIQPEIGHVTPADVKSYHLGAVLNGGGSTPGADKHASVSDWVALADAFHRASMDTSDGGQAIPVMWGTDAVHGHNNVVGATLFPHNVGLGAARDPDLVRRIGAATAREVRATGLVWTFAPTLAVVGDVRWGRTYESYAEDPALVRDYARAMVRGLQGEAATASFLDDRHVIANAKHFLGDGGTEGGMDRGDTRLGEAELARIHGAGFAAAIEAGVQTVMASFSSWNGRRLHGHRYLLTDVLKGRMGFDGFVVGDWNGHRLVPGCRVDSCPAAVEAGIDMLMVPAEWKALYRNTLAQVKSGEISVARLDDAVTRILRVKMRAGLFDAPPPSRRALSGRREVIGSADHRALAREAVRKSLVLLKNNDGVLPLARGGNVLVAGKAAADVARQSGGWTLTWQGTDNAPSDFPAATSVFEGIRAVVEDGGGRAVRVEDGEWNASTFGGAPPDAAVVVFGEEPYAEWYGDRAGIEYRSGNQRHLKLLRRLKRSGVPVVSVFVSGRPLWVNREINASDAFVAAWLPGSEGGGVADVLFRDGDGGIAHDFVGTLSFSWPRHVHQSVLDRDTRPYQPLFPYGYGLSYQDDVHLADDLPEQAEYPPGKMDETWLFVTRPIPPWSLRLQTGGGNPVPVMSAHGGSGSGDNLTVAAVDWTFEGDGRSLRWRGRAMSTVALGADAAQDLSRYRGREAALSLAVRIDENPSRPVTAAMTCGDGCGAEVVLDGAIERMPVGEWQRLSIDLRCFVAGGVGLNKVSNALMLGTAGRLGLSIADVRLVPFAAAEADVRCREES